MAAGIGLREVKLGSDEAFKAFWEAASDFILFECLDDSGKGQGLAVGAITSRYHPDADGGFLKLDYVGASDEYYTHWIVDQGRVSQVASRVPQVPLELSAKGWSRASSPHTEDGMDNP